MMFPDDSFGKVILTIGLVIVMLLVILRLMRGPAPPPDDRP
jgi:hypothetical protein